MKNHTRKFSIIIILTAIFVIFAPITAEAATPEEQALLLQQQYQQVMFAQTQYQQALQIQLQQAQLLQAQALQAQALQTQALQVAQLQAQQIAQYQMALNAQAYNQANAIIQYNTLKTAQEIQLDNFYSMAHATGNNYIFGYTEEYRAEQQRATEAYLNYWGLK